LVVEFSRGLCYGAKRGQRRSNPPSRPKNQPAQNQPLCVSHRRQRLRRRPQRDRVQLVSDVKAADARVLFRGVRAPPRGRHFSRKVLARPAGVAAQRSDAHPWAQLAALVVLHGAVFVWFVWGGVWGRTVCVCVCVGWGPKSLFLPIINEAHRNSPAPPLSPPHREARRTRASSSVAPHSSSYSSPPSPLRRGVGCCVGV
jgi:hypothetical protein